MSDGQKELLLPSERRKLRFNILSKIYNYHFNNTGNGCPMSEFNSLKHSKEEIKFALDHLINLDYINRDQSTTDKDPFYKISTLGIEIVETQT